MKDIRILNLSLIEADISDINRYLEMPLEELIAKIDLRLIPIGGIVLLDIFRNARAPKLIDNFGIRSYRLRAVLAEIQAKLASKQEIFDGIAKKVQLNDSTLKQVVTIAALLDNDTYLSDRVDDVLLMMGVLIVRIGLNRFFGWHQNSGRQHNLDPQ